MLRNCIPKLVQQHKPLVNHVVVRGRKPSICRKSKNTPLKPPCFGIHNIVLVRGQPHHATKIKRFLYSHFWPMEPSVVGLWMPLDSPYLELLTYKYSTTGHRVLALERNTRTCELRLVGFSVSNVICPWNADELDQWAECTHCIPSRNRMHFCAHLYRKPNLFKKYHVSQIFEIEVVAVAQEVVGHGVGTMMVKNALDYAKELRYPLIQVICTSTYTSKICERLGMKREWSLDYSDYVDEKGRKVFLPRKPHLETVIYTMVGDKCD